MRHRKDTQKLGRTSSHNRALFANMLKSLILNERMVTTQAKGKLLKRYADKIITLAKKGTLAAKREAGSELMIVYNSLTSKEARLAKEKRELFHNDDRQVIKKLFETLAPRFQNRAGGYTRLIKGNRRLGDGAEVCLVEYLAE